MECKDKRYKIGKETQGVWTRNDNPIAAVYFLKAYIIDISCEKAKEEEEVVEDYLTDWYLWRCVLLTHYYLVKIPNI